MSATRMLLLKNKIRLKNYIRAYNHILHIYSKKHIQKEARKYETHDS